MALASWLREKERGSGKESNRERKGRAWRESNWERMSVEREKQGEEECGERATGRGRWTESNRKKGSVERKKQGEEYGKRATIENSSNIENEPKSTLSVLGFENGTHMILYAISNNLLR